MIKFNKLKPLVIINSEPAELFILFIKQNEFVAIINLHVDRGNDWRPATFTREDWTGSDFEEKSYEAGIAEDLFTNQEIIKILFEERRIK